MITKKVGGKDNTRETLTPATAMGLHPDYPGSPFVDARADESYGGKVAQSVGYESP